MKTFVIPTQEISDILYEVIAETLDDALYSLKKDFISQDVDEVRALSIPYNKRHIINWTEIARIYPDENQDILIKPYLVIGDNHLVLMDDFGQIAEGVFDSRCSRESLPFEKSGKRFKLEVERSEEKKYIAKITSNSFEIVIPIIML